MEKGSTGPPASHDGGKEDGRGEAMSATLRPAEAEAASLVAAGSSRFSIGEGRFRGIDGVEVVDTLTGACAVFARRGATLLDWKVPFGGSLMSLIDGYASAQELNSQNGVRNGIMAPFPNRIRNGRFRYDGRDFDLLPGVPEAERLIYHGFVRELELNLVGVRVGEEGAQLRFFTDAIAPGSFPGYPFALTLEILASMSATGLALEITATNVGRVSAPYAAGWHPYFRFGDAGIDALELLVPAGAYIATDARLMPLPASEAHASLDARPDLDFRRARALGGSALDVCLSGLAADADGSIRSHLRDPMRGCGLTVWQRGGLVHLFTADTLARGVRRSVAIEPVETMTDAFNRPDCLATIRLDPGASRSFSCGVEFHADLEATLSRA